MCITEYNEAETMQMFKEEGREEGREEGIKEGMLLSVKNLMQNLKCSAEKAMEMLGIPKSEYDVYMKML